MIVADQTGIGAGLFVGNGEGFVICAGNGGSVTFGPIIVMDKPLIVEI